MITITMPEWVLYCIALVCWIHIILHALRTYIAYLHAKWRKDYGKEYPHYEGENSDKTYIFLWQGVQEYEFFKGDLNKAIDYATSDKRHLNYDRTGVIIAEIGNFSFEALESESKE